MSQPTQNMYYGSYHPMQNQMQHPMQSSYGGNMYQTQHDYSGYEENHFNPQFQDFLEAIKTQKYAAFRQILSAHPEYKDRVDTETKQPPIYHAVVAPNEELALPMIKDLIALGVNPAYKDPLNQNVMSYIARDGKLLLFNYFMDLKVSPIEIDSYQQMPLFYAARDGRFEICKRILEYGGNPNQIDMNGQTCLFYAAKSGHLEICQLLVEYGCKYDHVDYMKQTALTYAKKEKHPRVIEYLTSLKGGNKVMREKSSTSETKSQTQTMPPKKKEKPAPQQPKKKEEPKYTYKLVFVPNSNSRIDVTDQEFNYFKQSYPELADYLMNPNKIPVQESEKGKENIEKVASKILQGVWKVKGAFIFHQPVDAVKLGCTDYYTIIKQPMDFGTIKSYLKAGHYQKLQQFIDDMNLVFKNCYLYNGTNGEVGQTGVSVEREFQRLCKENNVEQLLQDEVKSELQEDNPTTDMGDFERSMQQFSHDGGFMDDEEFLKHDNFPIFGDK